MHSNKTIRFLLVSASLFLAAAFVRAENAFDEAPTPVHTRAPDYPESLRRAGVSGIVSINVTIDENGDVTHATVAKSSDAGFEQAAIAAVTRWKFKPAKKAGQPVAVSVVLPVRFNVQ